MTTECPKKAVGSYCLSSDNGANALNHTADEWQTLVGKSFTMPVFCTKPDCSDMAVAGGGNTASYAIEMIANVTLCGFNVSAQSTNWPTTGPCATNNPNNYKPGDIDTGAGLFVVITGLTGGPSNLTAPSFTDVSLTK
jgi:hypothetical protein